MTVATGELWKTRDVAEFFGVEPATVIDWWQAGDLPGFRLRGRKGAPLRFRRDEIEGLADRDWRPTLSGDNSEGPAARQRPGPDTGKDASDAPRILRAIDQ